MLNTELPYEPTISLLGVHLRELKTYDHIKILHKCSQQHYSEEPKSGNNTNTYQLMNGGKCGISIH